MLVMYFLSEFMSPSYHDDGPHCSISLHMHSCGCTTLIVFGVFAVLQQKMQCRVHT